MTDSTVSSLAGILISLAFSNIGGMVSTVTDRGIESEWLTIHVEQNRIGEL